MADPTEVDAACQDETGSRVDDILAGKVELVDADATYRMLSRAAHSGSSLA